MTKFLIVLAVVVGLLALGPVISGNQGFVHVEIASYVIECSALTFAVLIALFILAIYVLLGILGRIFSIKTGVLSWFNESRTRSADKNMSKALRALLLEEYGVAQDISEKSLKWCSSPETARLINIASGIKSGDVARQKKAALSVDTSEIEDAFVISLLRAQNFEALGQWEEALELTTALRKSYEPNVAVDRVYFKSLVALGKYKEIEKNRKELQKTGLLTQDNFKEIISKRIISEVNRLNDMYVMKHMMNDLPKDIVERLEISNAFAERFNEIGDADTSLKIVEKMLKNNEDKTQVYRLIARWRTGDARIGALLDKEAQKSANTQNQDLVAARANMYLASKDYGHADALYENLISLDPQPLYYVKLGLCYQNTGSHEKAAMYFKEAARLEYRGSK